MNNRFSLTLLALLAPLAALGAEIRVAGVSGELLAAAQDAAKTVSLEDASDDEARFAADEAVISVMRSLGYSTPFVRTRVSRGSQKDITRLDVSVEPGPRTVIARTDVVITGEAKDDPDFIRLFSSVPKEGDSLLHAQFDGFLNDVTALAAKKGYFDAKFTRSDLGINARRAKAVWFIAFDSGRRYRFGGLSTKGSQIEEPYLMNLAAFKKGEPYDSGKLADFSQNLSETGWFSSVVLVPDLAKAKGSHEAELDLTAEVAPKKKNAVDIGLGISSDVGPNLTLSWDKPWINARGHSFESELSLDSKEQSADLTYTIPVKASPLTDSYALKAGFKRTSLNDTKSDSQAVAVSRYHRLPSRWQVSAGFHILHDNFDQASSDSDTFALYPELAVSRTRQRGGVMPVWGDTQRYSIEIGRRIWASDIDFIRLQASGTLIRTYAQKHRFVARYSAGWISTDKFERMPTDLRFFAGGDRSIRGYDYKSISPRDENGKLTGASKMLTASLEYQYNFTGRWWGALFADAGEAVRSLSSHDFKKSLGAGIRWNSPIGPVKLDIAHPVGDSGEKGWTFYMGLGGEL